MCVWCIWNSEGIDIIKYIKNGWLYKRYYSFFFFKLEFIQEENKGTDLFANRKGSRYRFQMVVLCIKTSCTLMHWEVYLTSQSGQENFFDKPSPGLTRVSRYDGVRNLLKDIVSWKKISPPYWNRYERLYHLLIIFLKRMLILRTMHCDDSGRSTSNYSIFDKSICYFQVKLRLIRKWCFSKLLSLIKIDHFVSKQLLADYCD